MEYWQAIILAIVEGLTEYLPISSTGHIIIFSSFMGINEVGFVKDYTVVVQFGAILSVLVLYWRKFLVSLDIYKVLFIGFLPAAVIGLSVKNVIDQILGSVQVVAWALIVGGLVLLFIDNKLKGTKEKIEDISIKNSLMIGLCQCLAFIPGVSRSAATILGGMWQGLNRKAAAEFSFLLALPTLTGASFLKLYKAAPHLTSENIQQLLLGNLISFIVGLITIKAFIQFLSKYGFQFFGWYRICLGLAILLLV